MANTHFPKRKVIGVTALVDSLMDLVKKNIIAKTDLTADAVIGNSTVSVYNAFQFRKGDEVVFIDYDYDYEDLPHFKTMEYAKIKEVLSTTSIELEIPLQDNWTLAKRAFIQKTLGHSPLMEKHVYYGDREVIPTEYVAVTVDPGNVSNEWLYIPGGLGENYNIKITVYSKSIDTDGGKRILDKYCDNICQLLNENIHLRVDVYETQLQQDALTGATTIVLEDNAKNQELIAPYNPLSANEYEYPFGFELQDNIHATCWIKILSVTSGGGFITATLEKPLPCDFLKSEFAILRRMGQYIYESRADGIEYGLIQKGSAFIRAGQINWFGKTTKEFRFPQGSNQVNYLPRVP